MSEGKPLGAIGATTEGDENGHRSGDEEAVLGRLKQTQREIQPLGKTKILEVPGYDGELAIEYSYISSEVTESIARKVSRETKNLNGVGTSLLSSLDTLIAGCKRVLIKVDGEWQSIGGENRVVKLTPELATILDFDADDERETVLALFGSEHAVTQQNIIYSRWLGNMKRTIDEDFFG